MAEKYVLDVCCGGRMMWFDKSNPHAIYADRRKETVSNWNYDRSLEVCPDVLSDFTELPFASNTFHLVVFDPPHLATLGNNSRTAGMYGKLFGDWKTDIASGFSECFRVLKPYGTLIFKWNEHEFKVSEILELAPYPPMFGHKSGKLSLTHWVTFTKPNNACSGLATPSQFASGSAQPANR